MKKQELCDALKATIISGLNLEDVTPGDIDDNAPLFGDAGLRLDSLDAVELAFLVEKDYGIAVGDADTARTAFTSINGLAEFILAHQPQAKQSS